METGRERLIIPALGPFYEATSPYAYALMRFATEPFWSRTGCKRCSS